MPQKKVKRATRARAPAAKASAAKAAAAFQRQKRGPGRPRKVAPAAAKAVRPHGGVSKGLALRKRRGIAEEQAGRQPASAGLPAAAAWPRSYSRRWRAGGWPQAQGHPRCSSRCWGERGGGSSALQAPTRSAIPTQRAQRLWPRYTDGGRHQQPTCCWQAAQQLFWTNFGSLNSSAMRHVLC